MEELRESNKIASRVNCVILTSARMYSQVSGGNVDCSNWSMVKSFSRILFEKVNNDLSENLEVSDRLLLEIGNSLHAFGLKNGHMSSFQVIQPRVFVTLCLRVFKFNDRDGCLLDLTKNLDVYRYRINDSLITS